MTPAPDSGSPEWCKAHGLLASFVDAIVGKRLTYARLIAKVPA